LTLLRFTHFFRALFVLASSPLASNCVDYTLAVMINSPGVYNSDGAAPVAGLSDVPPVPHAPELREAVAPTRTPVPRTNRELLAGPPVSPLQRISLYSDREFEQLVEEWAYASLSKNYARVQHAPGAGDKGRDVIGFVEEDITRSPYDLYQCKQYGRSIQPGDIWIELGKVCVYTYRGDYRVPRRYYFVCPHGVGPTVQQLLQQPEKLKEQLIANWEEKCETRISQRERFPLDGPLRAYVQTFDFAIFDAVEPLRLVEDLRGTPFFAMRFGGLTARRPDPASPPETIAPGEAHYVKQLLAAYTDYKGIPFVDTERLRTDSQLQAHFARQREAFYRAESLREFERDTLADDSGFLDLKEEIFRGVIDICEADHTSGFHRVNAVTGEARRLQPTDYVLTSDVHLEDRAGICHHLANEDRLQWVRP
jgi:hypothetical protein